MTDTPRFRRPLALASLDGLRADADTATRVAAAHATADLLLARGREAADPEATERFVHLAENIGLEPIAELWATAPAVSLPGALWRLYAIREWIHRSPAEVSRQFDAGRGLLSVGEVISGVEDPPGPDAVRTMADEVLAGAFTGDVSIALLRAAAFARIVQRGRVDLSEHGPQRLTGLAEDLEASAAGWEAGTLD